MPSLEEFSPHPVSYGRGMEPFKEVELEKYVPASKKDSALYDAGISLLLEYTKDRKLKIREEEIELPVKDEGWPGDGWGDGKNSNYGAIWDQMLLSNVHCLISEISVIKRHNIRNVAETTGTWRAILRVGDKEYRSYDIKNDRDLEKIIKHARIDLEMD